MRGERRKSPIQRLLRPVNAFAEHKLAGAFLLLFATALAIGWANSPWRASYLRILDTTLAVGFGGFSVEKPLLHWINDGLMGIFFFVVGLEIKREILAGELASLRKAALPISAAIGGMAVPAALYAALNPDPPASWGWGIPMATDIAFALGILAIAGDRIPSSLRVFLTALAIVDDLGAILVIAIFYTDSISLVSLSIGGVLLGISVLFNALGVRSNATYFLLGTCVWLAFLKSGVHATIAAVLMALTIPARTRVDVAHFREQIAGMLDDLARGGPPEKSRLLTGPQQEVLDRISAASDDASAPLQRLEHGLAPLVTFLVLPVFALANAGVTIEAGFSETLTHPVFLGVLAGLFAGKQIGIAAFAWLAVRLKLADLPAGVGWRHVHGVAVLGGVGFTMALFIAGLAFRDPALHAAAKAGILAASALSAVVGLALLARAGPRESAEDAQLQGDLVDPERQ